MLTDVQIRSLRPREKTYRLFDSGGLYLEVSPHGGKWWRLKYRYRGQEKRISLGTYPSTGLKEARVKRDSARKQLAAGIDPSAARKAQKKAQDDSVEAVAREWHDKQAPAWTTAHAEKVLSRLVLHVFPWIGSRAVSEVTTPELLTLLRRTEGLGTGNVSHRLRGCLGQVFRYAIASGRAERNPAKDVEGALKPVRHGHYAAITEPEEVGALMRAIDGYRGSFVVQSALKLAAYTFVRPGELRGAEWKEMDWDAAEWRIPKERMKMKAPHTIPLSYQALDVLHHLENLHGWKVHVLAGRTTGLPISIHAITMALRSIGYPKEKMTGHGFRAMARTLLDEVLGVRPDIIEHQLAHTVRDPLGRAYNRTQHLAERRRMMQLWADYLDGLKNGAEVVPIRGRA